LSPAASVKGNDSGESTETLINVDEEGLLRHGINGAFAEKVKHLDTDGCFYQSWFSQLASFGEEQTGPALELAASFADSLMDHFAEKGLLAKEIKVAEIVELKEEDDENVVESVYSCYEALDLASYFSYVDVSSHVEVGETVSFESVPTPSHAANATALTELIQEGKPTMHIPRLMTDQLSGNKKDERENVYAIEFVVQDFDRVEPVASAENAPAAAQNQADSVRDTDSGCSVTTCHGGEDYFASFAPPVNVVSTYVAPQQQQQQPQPPQQPQPRHRVRLLMPSTSMSSDETDFVFPRQSLPANEPIWADQDSPANSNSPQLYGKTPEGLVDLDWETLDPGEQKLTVKQLAKSNTFPRKGQRRSTGNENYAFLAASEDADSDGVVKNAFSPLVSYETDLDRHSAGEYFSGDDEYPQSDGGSTIQDAIKRQQEREYSKVNNISTASSLLLPSSAAVSSATANTATTVQAQQKSYHSGLLSYQRRFVSSSPLIDQG